MTRMNWQCLSGGRGQVPREGERADFVNEAPTLKKQRTSAIKKPLQKTKSVVKQITKRLQQKARKQGKQ